MFEFQACRGAIDTKATVSIRRCAAGGEISIHAITDECRSRRWMLTRSDGHLESNSRMGLKMVDALEGN